jgi:hypothetical protein
VARAILRGPQFPAYRQLDRLRRVAELLRARPPEEPLWEALTAVVALIFDHGESLPDERWTTGVRLVLGEMEPQGELVKGGAAIERDGWAPDTYESDTPWVHARPF